MPYFFFNILFIYLAALGLICGMWDLPLLCAGSLVVACGLSYPRHVGS